MNFFKFDLNSFLAKSCDSGKVYTECASTCQITCYNMNQDISQQCSDDCTAGCVCPPNTYQDTSKNNTCVPIEECSCFYRNTYYVKHDKVMMDCNEWYVKFLFNINEILIL